MDSQALAVIRCLHPLIAVFFIENGKTVLDLFRGS